MKKRVILVFLITLLLFSIIDVKAEDNSKFNVKNLLDSVKGFFENLFNKEIIGKKTNSPSYCGAKWTCSDWKGCANGKRTRKCKLTGTCEVLPLKPIEVQECGCDVGRCADQYSRCNSAAKKERCPNDKPFCYDSPLKNRCIEVEPNPLCDTIGEKLCFGINEYYECVYDEEFKQNMLKLKTCGPREYCKVSNVSSYLFPDKCEIDNEKPVVILIEPEDNSYRSANLTFSISCEVSDNVELKSVELWVSQPGRNSGYYLDEIRQVSGKSATVEFRKKSPELGMYVWSCKAIDVNDNFQWTTVEERSPFINIIESGFIHRAVTCQGNDPVPLGLCNSEKKYCDPNSGIFIDNCMKCGCPSGSSCSAKTGQCILSSQENLCRDWPAEPLRFGKPYDMNFITPENECAINSPYYCRNINNQMIFVPEPDKCGCPKGSVWAWDEYNGDTIYLGYGFLGSWFNLGKLNEFLSKDVTSLCGKHEGRKCWGAAYQINYLNCADNTVEGECSILNPGKRCRRQYDWSCNTIDPDPAYVNSYLQDDSKCPYPQCRDGTSLNQCSTNEDYKGTKCLKENGKLSLLDKCKQCGCPSDLSCNSNGKCYNQNDNESPKVVLLSPPEFANIEEDTELTFSCSATDNKRLEKIELWVKQPGSSLSLIETKNVVGKSSTVTFTKTYINTGRYEWTCKSYDTNGNLAEGKRVGKTQTKSNFDITSCKEGKLKRISKNECLVCNKNGIYTPNDLYCPIGYSCSSNARCKCSPNSLKSGSVCLVCDQYGVFYNKDDSKCPSGDTCNSDGLCGSNTMSCVSQCIKRGTTKCSDNENYEVCNDYNNDGCLEWGSEQQCNSGETCKSGKCGLCNPGERRGCLICNEDGTDWKADYPRCNNPDFPYCSLFDGKCKCYPDEQIKKETSCFFCNSEGTAYRPVDEICPDSSCDRNLGVCVGETICEA